MKAAFAGAALAATLAIAGAAFAPVFTDQALYLPLLAVLAPVLVADLLAVRWRALAGARPLLGFGLGVLGLLLVLDGPLAAAVDALPVAATSGWLRTLESTWPVRPDPELVGFVALTVLVAAVLSVELLRRTPAPAALVPGLVVLGLSQAYAAAYGRVAVAIAVGYAVAASTVLACAGGPADPALAAASETGGHRRRWPVRIVAAALLAISAAAGSAWASVLLDPFQRPAYSLHDRHELAELPAGITNPLDEIAGRLQHPEEVVFVNRTAAPVDRWPIAVLDTFDGANWTSTMRYRPMGGELEPAVPTNRPVAEYRATVAIRQRTGPMLPVRFRPKQVNGVAVLVDPATGMLLTTTQDDPQPAYELVWQEPDVAATDLADAALESATGLGNSGPVPAALTELARTATSDGAPSLRTALQLERWLREHYQVASGEELPTGHGSAQLQHFLTVSKRGTSEQFATAYVVLAGSLGIPARLVVGFRQPAADPTGDHVVRNGDVLAWPEVAVLGVGWVPLDPTSGAAAGEADHGLATATEQLRKDLPDTGAIGPDEAPLPTSLPPPSPPPPAPAWWPPVLAALVLTALTCWLAGVPLTKRLRRHRRRRAAPNAAVIGAWLEARDQLRDHRVSISRAMTVRDVREKAALSLSSLGIPAAAGKGGLAQLANCVDLTVWSGRPIDRLVAARAWAAVDELHRVLSRVPLRHRLRAWFDPRSLLPLRQ